MRIRPMIFILLMTLSLLLSMASAGESGQELLVDDATYEGYYSASGNYEFEVFSDNPAVVGIRPLSKNSCDIGIYEDTAYEELIESSESAAEAVNFVVLDDDSWTNPTNLRGQVSSNLGDYIIEMENEIDRHPVGASWVGSMDRPQGGPVLNFGSPGSHDEAGLYGPTVVYAEGEYRMWYTIFDGSTERIGYAHSTDGIRWDKNSESVLDPTPGSWDEHGVSHPSVLYKGGMYYMWYTGNSETNQAIGYATSPDGIEWTKPLSYPCLRPGSNSGDTYGTSQPSVLFDETKYCMWYAGYDGSNYCICYAYSYNGINWYTTRNSIFNPIFDPILGNGWDSNNVFEPSVIHDGTTYHMWYGGDAGSNTRIGYATSDDGIIWARYPKNPVLDIGSQGTWDDTHLSGLVVFQAESSFHMWYTGHDGKDSRIGYASSKDGSMWAKSESYPEVLDTYVVNNIIEGLTYTIELDVPSTVDLDMFLFCSTGGQNDALADSTKTGAGVDESITFTAPISGDYMLVITNEDGGTGRYTVLTESPPIPNIKGNLVADRNGRVSLEAEAYYPGLTEDSAQPPVGPVDISGDGSYLAVGWGSCISYFSTESNIPLWTLDINEHVHELKLSDSGEHLVVLSQKTVYFFHTDSGIPLWSFDTGYSGASEPGNRIDMTRDGRFIAFKVWGNRILIFDTVTISRDTPATPYWDYDFGDEIVTTKLSGDGRYLALGGNHKHEFQLAWIPGRSINWTHTGDDPIYSASLSYDGSMISNGQGIQHNVSLFDAASSIPDWSCELEGRQFEQVMSDDGRYFVSSNHMDGDQGTWSGFALWDTSKSDSIWELHICEDIESTADAVDMDRNARYVVGGSSLNTVYLLSDLADGNSGWDAADGIPVYTYTTGGEIRYNSVSISADGTYFAAGSRDGSVYLFTTVGGPDIVWSWNPSSSASASGDYSWDFDDSVDTDGDGDFTNDGDFKGPDPSYVYNKNGNYTVTLTLTAEDNVEHIYTMLVTVDIQEPGQQGKLSKPGLPLAALLFMAALLGCVYIGNTEVGRYGGISFIFPLYTRLKKEEVLEHFMRGRIYEHIRRNPGDHYNNIKQELGLKNGSLAYHLRTLEKEEFIKSKRDGIYKRFYLVGIAIPEKTMKQLSPMEKEIIELIKRDPGIIQKEISRTLKQSQQIVSYHVNLMIHSGLIRAERHGKTYRYFCT